MPEPRTNPSLMYIRDALSRRHARSVLGGTDASKVALLTKLLIKDYGHFESEFGGALVAADWSTAVTAGGGPTAFAYAAVRGGTAQGATGTTDNDATAIYRTQTFLDPADNPLMIIRWKANAVTGFSFEVGFSDPKSDEALPGVTDVDTPAVGNGVTDILAIHMDTDQTLATVALVGDGTTGSAAKTDITTTPGGSTGFTPTAATYQTYILGIRANLGFAFLWDGDVLIANQQWGVTNGPDSGVLVRPYALFRTRNTTSKTIDIDFWGCYWERNG